MADTEAYNFETVETYQAEPTVPKKEFVFDEDYGFSFVPVISELEKTEEVFKNKFAEQQTSHETTLSQVKYKLDSLHSVIMPFLINLSKDPEKEYVHWPDRSVKIKSFINKINELMES